MLDNFSFPDTMCIYISTEYWPEHISFMLVAYLASKLTKQTCVLQNNLFSEKGDFPEVTHYFCFFKRI